MCTGHSQLDWANTRDTRILLNIMKIPFKYITGHYKGVEEQSFLLIGNHETIVKELCIKYNQECYLDSACDRTTELVYLKPSKREFIGTMKHITRDHAKTLDTYTKLDNGLYYAVL